MSPVCNHAARLHAAMAGRGDPYAVATPARLRLLHALQARDTLADAAAALGLSGAEFARELEPLRAASLVRVDEGQPRPDVLVADAELVARIDADAATLGHAWAALLRERWTALEDAYGRLAVAATLPFRDAAFLFVGDHVLDVGLLDALARDGALLPPAPPRPAPTRPDARYYFWLIEGEHDQLGQYGQRTTELPWPGWLLLTFGRYETAGVRNAARDALEARAQTLLAAGSATPAALAAALNVPLVTEAEAAAWRAAAATVADELVAVYHARAPALRALHAAAWPAERAPRFGELVCWHDHLAYAHAIDALAATGLLTLPPEEFTAAVWHEGVGVGEF